MEQEYPLVSAIMLAGKIAPANIMAGIECFKSQDYSYKELIIVNNAQNQLDASSLNIKAEKDIFIVDTPQHLTTGMARNYGISAANGQILAQFDADYWHSPSRLSAQVAGMAKNESHIAVFNKTPSHPNSIAIVASEAVPTPASTITGTEDCSFIKVIFVLFCIPIPEPMGDPNGIIAHAPISSNFFVIIRSSEQYTMTSKPSLTKTSVDLIVSIMFGYNVFLSPRTSSFTKLQPPISLASLSVLKASFDE